MATIVQSPLTGIIEEDKVYIDFGEHEGKSVMEIADTHPEYYHYMVSIKEKNQFFIRRSKDKSFRLYIKETVYQ
jgi:hypothetical protein